MDNPVSKPAYVRRRSSGYSQYAVYSLYYKCFSLFGRISQPINRNGSYVDKFVGDSRLHDLLMPISIDYMHDHVGAATVTTAPVQGVFLCIMQKATK